VHKAFYSKVQEIQHLSRVNFPQAEKSSDFGRIGMGKKCAPESEDMVAKSHQSVTDLMVMNIM
jgi:hypothetical protein